MIDLKAKKLIFTNNLEEADLITHSSTFHADEVFSTIVLTNINDNEEFKISRVNELNTKTKAIVYDIGYGKYDHHQIGGNGTRDDGINYCSFGLIWKEFGKVMLKRLDIENIDSIYNTIDKKIVEVIDANDNGQILSYKTEFESIPNIVALFNSSWDEENKQDEYFNDIYCYMTTIFNKIIKKIDSKLKARKYVEIAIDNVKDNILILDKFMPWKDVILESNNEKANSILFVIFPSNRGGYSVHAVPNGHQEFALRMLFPLSWAGLKDKEFQEVTGVNSAKFCHNARFICSTNTLEDAYKLASIAIEQNINN